MADSTATPTAGADATANQPSQVAATSQPAVELSDDAKQAGFTNEDFSHPDYGRKTKALYDGFQKKAEEASKIRKDLDEVKAFIQANPKLRKAFKEVLREAQGLPPEETATEPEEQSETPVDAKAHAEAEVAISELYTHLGTGDPHKGREVYQKEWAPLMETVLPGIDPRKPARERIALAMKFIADLRKPANTTAAPAKEEAPTGSAVSEFGRATVSTAPSTKPKTDDEIMRKALADAGVRDLSELARMAGSIV